MDDDDDHDDDELKNKKLFAQVHHLKRKIDIKKYTTEDKITQFVRDLRLENHI